MAGLAGVAEVGATAAWPRSADASLAGAVTPDASCNASAGFTFAWASNASTAAGGPLLPAAAAAAAAVGSSPALLLPARTLAAGQTAAFTLTACVAGAAPPAACGAGAFAYAVTPSPLVALIGGGGGGFGEAPLTLSASASYDPDGAPFSSLAFAWACARVDAPFGGSGCAARDGTPTALGAASTQALQLAGGAAGAPAAYVVTLTVSQGGRSAAANTTLSVLRGALPVVSIAGSAARAGAKADPAQQLVLLASASASVPGAVATRWSVAAQSGVAGPLLNLSDPAVCATPLTSASLVLRPDALAPGATYAFVLTATDAVGASGYANATVTTSAPPRGGWAALAPGSGTALATPFNLTAAGWSADADELPLSYAADYTVEGAAPGDAGAGWVSLTNGGFQESPALASLLLPAGAPAGGNVVTLRVAVRSALGAVAYANASALVTWPPFAAAADVAAFVDDQASKAQASVGMGDVSAALQVVGGLTALLNSNASATAVSGGSGSSGGSSSGAPAPPTSAPAAAAAAAAADVAAAAQRTELLTVVAAAVNQSLGTVSARAALESSAAIVSSLLAAPTQVSGAGATAALAVLGTIAAQGAAVTPAAAQSVADAVTSVVAAAQRAAAAAAPAPPATSGGSNTPPATSGGGTTGGGSSGSGGGTSSSLSSAAAAASSAALLSVLQVLDSLAQSQKAGLQVPGQMPAVLSTSSIGLSVLLDEADSPRLTSEPLVAASNAAVAFEPLPPGALAAAPPGARVYTVLLALAFDAHGGAGSGASGGMARLAFSDAASGAEIGVANLSAPLRFTLAPAALSSGGVRDACAWWSEAEGAYVTRGCAALPSPLPAGHSAAFDFNASAPAAAFPTGGAAWLAASWVLEGPLTAGCEVAFLDCSNATVRAAGPTLQLDPASPLTAPVLSCGPNGSAPVRAFTGARCALRNASGAEACAWDAVRQAFAGPGCVAANATHCACTHATDFASSPAINIPVCTASDLVGLTPADLISKLRVLFVAVMSLFAFMLVGAALGAALDARARRALLARLARPACGFREAPGSGAWLWRLHLDELEDELAPASGPAVELGRVFGIPFVRLRAALPQECFGTPFAAALGRRHGFSARGMGAAAEMHADLLRHPSKRRASAISAAATPPVTPRVLAAAAPGARLAAAAVAAAAAARAAEDAEEFIGTALVLAFISITQTLPATQLAARRAAAEAHFSGVTTPSGGSFSSTVDKALWVLSPGVLNCRQSWLASARLLRLTLAQAPDGSWPASDGVAFALLARSAREVAALRLTLLERVQDRAMACLHAAAAAADAAADAAEGGDASGLGGRGNAGGVSQAPMDEGLTPRAARNDADDAKDGADDDEEKDEDMLSDDPMRASAEEMLAHMPHALRTAGAESPGLDAARVWATACAVAVLETFSSCWLWTDGELYPEVERTIVDAGREWLEAQAEAHPALRALLAEDEVLLGRARRAARAWQRAWKARVRALRRAHGVRDRMGLSHAHRVGVALMRALTQKHSTFSVFLSEPLDGLQRWQLFVLLVSVVLTQLLCNIWVRCRCDDDSRSPQLNSLFLRM
jgi:hypothetical protein